MHALVSGLCAEGLHQWMLCITLCHFSRWNHFLAIQRKTEGRCAASQFWSFKKAARGLAWPPPFFHVRSLEGLFNSWYLWAVIKLSRSEVGRWSWGGRREPHNPEPCPRPEACGRELKACSSSLPATFSSSRLSKCGVFMPPRVSTCFPSWSVSLFGPHSPSSSAPRSHHPIISGPILQVGAAEGQVRCHQETLVSGFYWVSESNLEIQEFETAKVTGTTGRLIFFFFRYPNLNPDSTLLSLWRPIKTLFWFFLFISSLPSSFCFAFLPSWS